jgi:hypothetical protein
MGAEPLLPVVAVFPVFIGAFAVIGASILVLRAQGVPARGGAYLGWMWRHVPKTLLALCALAFVFSWQVFEKMPDYPRGSPEARAGSGGESEAFIGFATVFYVYGVSILVGALRALKQK